MHSHEPHPTRTRYGRERKQSHSQDRRRACNMHMPVLLIQTSKISRQIRRVRYGVEAMSCAIIKKSLIEDVKWHGVTRRLDVWERKSGFATSLVRTVRIVRTEGVILTSHVLPSHYKSPFFSLHHRCNYGCDDSTGVGAF